MTITSSQTGGFTSAPFLLRRRSRFVQSALRLKLLSGSGILNRSVYGRLIEERDGRSGRWLSTIEEGSRLNIVGRMLPPE